MRLFDPPITTDDIGDPPGVLGFLRVARSIGETERPFGIAQQRERVLELLRKGEVLGDRVEADTKNDGALGEVLGIEIAEPATLHRSAGCVGLWIEPEDDILPLVIG